MKNLNDITNLNDLHELLIEMENSQHDDDLNMDCKWNDYYGVELSDLPTFGGEEPNNTGSVWSWDDDSILVGDGSVKTWTIEKRRDIHHEPRR